MKLFYDAHDGPVVASDGTNTLQFKNDADFPATSLRNGDRIRIGGSISNVRLDGIRQTRVCCTNLTVLAHDQLPPPRRATARTINRGTLEEYELITAEGTVTDIAADDVHASWATAMLEDDGEAFYVLLAKPRSERFDAERLIGARVSVTGIFTDIARGVRKLHKYGITINTLTAIRILAPSPADRPDNATDVFDFDFQAQRRAPNSAKCYAVGCVIAVWGGNNLLLRTADGELVRGELSRPDAPAYGTQVRLVGSPETDLVTPILIRATWRPGHDGPPLAADVNDTSAGELQTFDFGWQQFKMRSYGTAVRLRGIVRSLPVKSSDGLLYVENDGQMVAVDASSVPDALRGIDICSEVEICGTCVIDTEKMTQNRLFPRVNSYRIVLRTPADVRILAKPSWWTPVRLVSVIGALLALVIGILLWNILLRRIISRRSRELETEIAARVGSELKVYERTRLAVELHDAISQNLTGAALALRAADAVADDNPPKLHANLSIALQTLDSCRDELRNCIWDLRNLTLEEASVDEAIRKTVQPHIGNATLVVRFNVPRNRFSDNTIHAILRVVRELASNSVRHGHATEIRVAGTIEGDMLLFSVRDNGCGYDPATAPGMAQGHFGLQGIRDRIKTFEGETTIDSRPGAGTKVTIALHVPKPDSGDEK